MDYKAHREYLKNIMTRIFKNNNNLHDYLLNSAISMGLKVKANQIFFSNNSDQEPFWDFTIYEKINGKKSLYDISLENDFLSADETDYLKKMIIFETALYRIVKSDGEIVHITNIENGNEYRLSDINLSKQKHDGNYIFFRLLKNEEYYMGSGFYFYFPQEVIETVIRRKKILIKSKYKINKSITLFRVMFMLYKMYGILAEYRD